MDVDIADVAIAIIPTVQLLCAKTCCVTRCTVGIVSKTYCTNAVDHIGHIGCEEYIAGLRRIHFDIGIGRCHTHWRRTSIGAVASQVNAIQCISVGCGVGESVAGCGPVVGWNNNGTIAPVD